MWSAGHPGIVWCVYSGTTQGIYYEYPHNNCSIVTGNLITSSTADSLCTSLGTKDSITYLFNSTMSLELHVQLKVRTGKIILDIFNPSRFFVSSVGIVRILLH